MVKGSFLMLCCLFITVLGFSQEDEQYRRFGLVKASATIAPSKMLNREVNNIYLNGFLEFYVDEHFSVKGESYFYIDGTVKNPQANLFIQQGMRTYFGFFAHVGKKNWDHYVGFQPGISMIRPQMEVTSNRSIQVNPSLAFHLGTTFFVWKYFNFYADLAYVNSNFYGLQSGSTMIDELILSAGLGFHLNAIKKK